MGFGLICPLLLALAPLLTQNCGSVGRLLEEGRLDETRSNRLFLQIYAHKTPRNETKMFQVRGTYQFLAVLPNPAFQLSIMPRRCHLPSRPPIAPTALPSLTTTMSNRPMQRIRGAIDRSLAEAEEMARQRATSPGSTGGRSVSTSRRPARSPVANPDATTDGGGPDPDPAVFEAAFVIDDPETPMPRTDTPTIVVDGEGQAGDGSRAGAGADGEAKQDGDATDGRETAATPSSAAKTPTTPELPPDIKIKLRKLEKLETTYPGAPDATFRLSHD